MLRYFRPGFFAAGLAARLIGSNSASLWLDEAISKYRASVGPATYFTDLSRYTGTNLWEILLMPFANGPVWLLRLPALISSMLGLWLSWRIMDRLAFTQSQRLTAAVPLALLPGLLWQAQDARYYAALGTMYMAGVLFALERRWLGLLACTGLLPYLHPVGPAYALGAWCVAWLCRVGSGRALWVGALAIVAWLPKFYQLLSIQAIPGLQAAGVVQPGRTEFWLRKLTLFYAIDQTAQAFVVNTLNLTGRLMLMVWLLCVLAMAIARFNQRAVRLSFVAATTPIIALLAMTVLQPVFFYRPIQPIILPVCLLVGLILAPGTARSGQIASALGLVLLLVGLWNWNPSFRGGYIDRGAQVISENWRPGDRIVYASDTVALPFEYYLREFPSCFIPDSGMGVLPRDVQILPPCDNYTVPGTWLVWPRSPAMKTSLVQSLVQATGGMRAAWRSDVAWHFDPIEIYYLP